jgi:thymidylate kinase
VQKGFHAIAAAEPKRVRIIDATGSVEETRTEIWKAVASFVTA